MRKRAERKTNWRTRMGFNQEHYASILGITKSLLSLVELHQRTPPPQAFAKDTYMIGQWVEFEKNWKSAWTDPEEIEKARKELHSGLNKVLDARDSLILKGKKMEGSQSYESLVKTAGFIHQEYEKNEDENMKNALGAAGSIIHKKLNKCSIATELILQIQQRTIAFQIAEFENELEKLNKKEA
jgi:transcriptional regulator with XRE-family HTH domain